MDVCCVAIVYRLLLSCEKKLYEKCEVAINNAIHEAFIITMGIHCPLSGLISQRRIIYHHVSFFNYLNYILTT